MKKNLTKLYMITVLMLVVILPTMATTYVPKSYEVPWSATENYVIIQTGDGVTRAMVSPAGQPAPVIKQGQGYQFAVDVTGYKLDGVTGVWSASVPSKYAESVYTPGEGQQIWLTTSIDGQSTAPATLLYANNDVKSSFFSSTVLFPKATFQLPVTPWVVALKLALSTLLGGISGNIGIILQAVSVLLGILLAVRFLPRLIRYWVR